MERMAKSEYAKTQPTTTENLAVIGDALGDKFRFSYEPNLFDDYLNPFVYLGDIAGGLANVPQDVKTGNYSTAAARIVNPLLMGAMAGYSSKLAGTGFVNELFNPAAGMGYNKPVTSRALNNSTSSVDDVGRGIKQSSNKIDQNIINNYTQREVDWLNSEEAIKRNMAATGKSREAVIKERDKIFKQIDKTTLNILDDKADLATGVYVSDKNNPFINLFNIGNEELMLNAADHEIKHAISQQAIRSADSLIDLVTNPYKKYPILNVKKFYDYILPGESITSIFAVFDSFVSIASLNG
jgi:hypothetical protein